MEQKIIKTAGFKEITSVIPHRFPFLLIDKLLEYSDDYAIGLKNVTINEDFFNGHFPNQPIMPGVLTLEALAQTACAGALLIAKERNEPKALFLLAGMDEVKFKATVTAGDTLILDTKLLKSKGPIRKIEAVAKVGEIIVAQAIITAFLQPIEEEK